MYRQMTKAERSEFTRTKRFLEGLGFQMRQAGGGSMTLPDHATASFSMDADGYEMVVSSLGSPYGPYSMDEQVGVEFWRDDAGAQEHLAEAGFMLQSVRDLAPLVRRRQQAA
jgi:hypothetical protein